MNTNNVIQIESLSQMPFEDILSLYRQGYKLEENFGNIDNIDNIDNIHNIHNIGEKGEKGEIISLATCPGTIAVGSTLTLAATASSGTSPYTFHWSITKPDGSVDTSLTGGSNQYKFDTKGNYTVSVYTTDSCPTGSKTSSTQTCNVTVGDTGGVTGACIGCDLTNNYCLASRCIPKKYVLYGGVGLVALIILVSM